MTNPSFEYLPPTLREILDGGGDLADYVSVDTFCDDVAEVADTLGQVQLLREHLTARLLDRTPIQHYEARLRQMWTELLWSIELVDNPDLLPRVLEVLPDGEVRVRDETPWR